MPDFLKYQKSVSEELLSIKDRVRNFIDDKHWGEDGRYKEEILKEVISSKLPGYAKVGTGFVMCGEDKITSQIDIIVYDGNLPVLFKKGDFVIVPKESVFGIIEVKTDAGKCLDEAILKAHNNGILIDKCIFNGVFSYEYHKRLTTREDRISQVLTSALVKNFGKVGYISLGKDVFVKYWEKGQPSDESNDRYSVYNIKDLSFGYFISNLIEDVHNIYYAMSVPESMQRLMYPIEGTKEAYKIADIETEE